MQAYMKSNNEELLTKINDTGDFNDEIEGAMKAAIVKFKESATW
jgi:F-type H+-transporting ATPase subunit alpha